jgi:hypothetical protein
MMRVPLSDSSAFQGLRELRMILQLADGERACRCALRSPSVESFPFRCKRCSCDFEAEFIKRDLI